MAVFKAGDLVYFPTETTKILRLRGVIDDDTLDLEIDIRGGVAFLSYSGKMSSLDLNPVIFHATPENHELLRKLYGTEFEAPPVKPTSREIIQAKLNKSTEPVPCWASNINERTQPTRKDIWVFIKECIGDCHDGRFSDFPYCDSTGKRWKYAIPFDPHTNEAITELPEGEYYE